MGQVIFMKKASGGSAHRYWRIYKTNSASGGFFHNELKVYLATVEATVNSSYLSHSGLQGWNAANMVDDNTGTRAFYTDTSGIGSYMQIDFGAGNEQELDELRLYVDGAVVAIWDIEYSDNGSSWTAAATGLDCSGGAGWKTITW